MFIHKEDLQLAVLVITYKKCVVGTSGVNSPTTNSPHK